MMQSDRSSAACASPPPLGDAWLLIEAGITYVEADGVRRWIERADPELAKKWQANVDHMVRTGMERASKRRSSWWPW